MGDGDVKIGSHSTGFFDYPNSFTTKNKLGENTSFDKAKQLADNRKVGSPVDVNNGTINHLWDTGGEVIVGQKQSDGSYTYDTYQTIMKDSGFGSSENSKRLSDVKNVTLFVDAVEELDGVEGFVVDEKNNIRIIGDPNSQEVINMILDHTKSREFEAVFMLINKLDNPQNKKVLTELANKLKELQNGIEQKEGQLKNEINVQSNNLSKMEVPFKQRISNAQNDVSIKEKDLNNANLNLKEVNRPGNGLIDKELSKVTSKLNNLTTQLNSLERVQSGESYNSSMMNKVNEINRRERDNYILWTRMNEPNNSQYSVNSSWDTYINNRSKITELKKEILLETSRQERREDVANEILPGLKNQVENTELLLEGVKHIKDNGSNQGPVVENTKIAVDKANSDIEFAGKQLEITEKKYNSSQDKVNQLRTKIENSENKVAKMFVLQQEINDIKFQLMNMDKFSAFASEWNKDTLRNNLIDKMYQLSSLQYEVGMVKSKPSHEYFSNVFADQHANPFDDKPSNSNSNVNNSGSHSNPFDDKPSSNVNNSGSHSNPFDDKPSSNVNNSGSHSNPFDDKPSNSNGNVNNNSSHSNPFDKDPFTSISQDYYVNPFDNGNFSSFDSEYKTDLKSLESMWDNSWNTVVQYSKNKDKVNYNQAKKELRSNENDLIRSQMNYQNKTENVLTNLPNSTEGAKTKAVENKTKAETNLVGSNNELKSAKDSFSNDKKLVEKRTEIKTLQNDLSNTSGIFVRMTEEAKNQLK